MAVPEEYALNHLEEIFLQEIIMSKFTVRTFSVRRARHIARTLGVPAGVICGFSPSMMIVGQ